MYNLYIKFFEYAFVIIENQKNNKCYDIYTKKLEEAMCFLYEVDTMEEAKRIQSNDMYRYKKDVGNSGEAKVNYALKWLDSSFEKISKEEYENGENFGFHLYNPEYINEEQEYDHIVVGKTGIFIIETKNYSGTIIIDKYGNWIREKNNSKVGTLNPTQQIRRHEKLLKSFIPEYVNIISIICIANDKAIIEGVENSTIPIVKSDMLVEYIENYQTKNTLMSRDEILKCVSLINEHIV